MLCWRYVYQYIGFVLLTFLVVNSFIMNVIIKVKLCIEAYTQKMYMCVRVLKLRLNYSTLLEKREKMLNNVYILLIFVYFIYKSEVPCAIFCLARRHSAINTYIQEIIKQNNSHFFKISWYIILLKQIFLPEFFHIIKKKKKHCFIFEKTAVDTEAFVICKYVITIFYFYFLFFMSVQTFLKWDAHTEFLYKSFLKWRIGVSVPVGCTRRDSRGTRQDSAIANIRNARWKYGTNKTES